jgi:protein N-terminal glutamine amidohydrolase
VIWDYHVVLWVQGVEAPEVWDLDAVGGCPMSGAQWTQATFPKPALTQRRFWPWFRLVEADVFVRDFRSDRSHMRGQGGEWQKPPPPWAAPCGEGERSNLWDYGEITEEQARAARRGGGAQGRGDVLDWEGWRRLNGV